MKDWEPADSPSHVFLAWSSSKEVSHFILLVCLDSYFLMYLTDGGMFGELQRCSIQFCLIGLVPAFILSVSHARTHAHAFMHLHTNKLNFPCSVTCYVPSQKWSLNLKKRMWWCTAWSELSHSPGDTYRWVQSCCRMTTHTCAQAHAHAI